MLAYYAQEGGFFTKAGLAVEMTSFPSTGGIMPGIAADALDVGIGDMIQIATATQHGVPLGFFAGGALYSSDSPTTVLCVSKNSSIRTAKDLEGQTVAVPAFGTQSAASTSEWLRANGADVAKVKLFELSFTLAGAALERGTVQAAMLGEPFINFARNDTRVLAKPFDVIAKSFYINSWFAKRDWAARNAPLLRRFTAAIYEAGRWANTHQDDTLQILAKVQKLEIERIRTMARITWASSLETRLMQPVIDIGAKYKLLDQRVAAGDLIVRNA